MSSLAQQSPLSRPGSLFDSLDNDLGKNVGLSRGHEVPSSVVQSVIQAADQGNRGTIREECERFCGIFFVLKL